MDKNYFEFWIEKSLPSLQDKNELIFLDNKLLEVGSNVHQKTALTGTSLRKLQWHNILLPAKVLHTTQRLLCNLSSF